MLEDDELFKIYLSNEDAEDENIELPNFNDIKQNFASGTFKHNFSYNANYGIYVIDKLYKRENNRVAFNVAFMLYDVPEQEFDYNLVVETLAGDIAMDEFQLNAMCSDYKNDLGYYCIVTLVVNDKALNQDGTMNLNFNIKGNFFDKSIYERVSDVKGFNIKINAKFNKVVKDVVME